MSVMRWISVILSIIRICETYFPPHIIFKTLKVSQKKTNLIPRNVGRKNFMRRNSVKITVSVKFGFLYALYQICGATYDQRRQFPKLNQQQLLWTDMRFFLPCILSGRPAGIRNRRRSARTVRGRSSLQNVRSAQLPRIFDAPLSWPSCTRS